MAAIHDELAAEGLIKDAFASCRKPGSKRWQTGRIYVTEKRIVFLASNPLLAGFGAIGGALMAMMKPKKLVLEIPRTAVTGVERTKFGINKNVLDISFQGSEEPARFAVKPYEEWAAAVQPPAAAAVTAS